MSEQHHLEEKVGAFVIIGLLAVGVLIISFGRLGQFFQTTYDITVSFTNTSGIIKNSQVLYRGAKVGIVCAPPQIANHGQNVNLILRINSDVKIPKGAAFKIGVYGLLGDRYVDVIPLKNEDASTVYLRDGDCVQGSDNLGLNDVLATAQKKMEEFDNMVHEIESRILTQDFIDDFHGSVKNARILLERGGNLLGEAEKGKGTLYTLLKDQQTADNLKEFIRNLREHGPLFYSDDSQDKDDDSAKVSHPLRHR